VANLMSIRGRALAYAAAAILGIAACAGAGPSLPSPSGGASPPSPGAPSGGSMPLQTGPTPGASELLVEPTDGAVSAAISLEGDRAVSEVVLPEIGATLQAVASDGTAFALSIPPDALLYAEEITMTPIAQVDGVPFSDGLVGAVDLQPEGLQLMEVATLEIRPADATAPETEIAFRYRADGAEVFLALMNPDPTKLTMPIKHFSGAGVGSGSVADLQLLTASQPTDIRDQIDAFVAQLMHEQGRRRITNEAFAELLEVAARRYYDSVILPAISRADSLVDTATLDDLPTIRRALLDWTAWERQLGLLGSELLRAERDALQTRVVEIHKRLFARIADLCLREHSIEAILMLTALARTLELAGISTDAVDWSGCLRFEVRFRSRLVSSHAHEDFEGMSIGQLDMIQTLEAKVLADDTLGPEAYTELVITHPPSEASCDSASMGYEGSVPSTFSTIRIWWQTEREQGGPDYTGDRPYRLRDVRLLYDVGTPEEVFSICLGGEFPAGHSRHWQSAYLSAHKDDVFIGRAGVTGGLLASGWELGSGDLIARKVYDRSLPAPINECDFWPLAAFQCSSGVTLQWTVQEQTTIEIYHDPIVSSK
jgi:hypothetical protein